MINPATFILMVIIGASPPQQRGEFQSYHHCYEAAQSEIASLGPDVRWDCVPTYRDNDFPKMARLTRGGCPVPAGK
jgi:hypothetical protein